MNEKTSLIMYGLKDKKTNQLLKVTCEGDLEDIDYGGGYNGILYQLGYKGQNWLVDSKEKATLIYNFMTDYENTENQFKHYEGYDYSNWHQNYDLPEMVILNTDIEIVEVTISY